MQGSMRAKPIERKKMKEMAQKKILEVIEIMSR
jgi:hypothetical protein